MDLEKELHDLVYGISMLFISLQDRVRVLEDRIHNIENPAEEMIYKVGILEVE